MVCYGQPMVTKGKTVMDIWSSEDYQMPIRDATPQNMP